MAYENPDFLKKYKRRQSARIRKKMEGLLCMQNYNKMEDIMESLNQQYLNLLTDERILFNSMLNTQGNSRLKRLISQINLRKKVKEKVKLTAIHRKMENISILETTIFNIRTLTDMLFYRLYKNENMQITKESYNKKLKEYQFISEKLEIILGIKEDILAGNNIEHSIIVADSVLTVLTNLLSKSYDSQMLHPKNDYDSKAKKVARDSILYNSSLYESIKDYQNLDEILKESLKKGYSYDIYRNLVDAFLVFKNESKSEETKQNEELKNNDTYVICSQANNDSILALYSKKQLIMASKALLAEVEKRQTPEDIQSLASITNHLSRRR